jgi:dipeptidase E
MGKLVALGGGELRESATRAIDQRIVELTGKTRPHAVFIPTASGDAVDYYHTFAAEYGKQLGCTTDALYLIRPDERPAPAEIAAKIAAADLIYVGGGNTLRMMKLWRRLGIDALLAAAYERGTVLSGISAGAMCWFSGGFSDSRSFASEDDDWPYIRVRGLGLVDALYCPHVDAENRLQPFEQFMQKQRLVGLGCDDCCALEIVDGQYRFIISRAGAQGYRVVRQRGQVVTDRLAPVQDYQSLETLLTP